MYHVDFDDSVAERVLHVQEIFHEVEDFFSGANRARLDQGRRRVGRGRERVAGRRGRGGREAIPGSEHGVIESTRGEDAVVAGRERVGQPG